MDVIKAMQSYGYVFRKTEELAILGLTAQTGMKALLLEGAPGAGKTFLAETYARALGLPLLSTQFHEWTDADELFVGVNVTAAVAGEASNVRQDGVLAAAARKSEEGPVVLLLDEIDKAPERVENLLLDALQSGRVPVAPGVHLKMNPENVVVFATSNAARPLSQALLRRFRRVQIQPLAATTMDQLVHRETGVRMDVCTAVRKIATATAEKDSAVATSQEVCNAVREAMKIASDADDLIEILCGWLARGPAGRTYLQNLKGQAHRLFLSIAAIRAATEKEE